MYTRGLAASAVASMRAQGRSFASMSLLHELCLNASHTNVDDSGCYDEHLPIPVELAGLPANLHTLKVTAAVLREGPASCSGGAVLHEC